MYAEYPAFLYISHFILLRIIIKSARNNANTLYLITSATLFETSAIIYKTKAGRRSGIIGLLRSTCFANSNNIRIIAILFRRRCYHAYSFWFVVSKLRWNWNEIHFCDNSSIFFLSFCFIRLVIFSVVECEISLFSVVHHLWKFLVIISTSVYSTCHYVSILLYEIPTLLNKIASYSLFYTYLNFNLKITRKKSHRFKINE